MHVNNSNARNTELVIPGTAAEYEGESPRDYLLEERFMLPTGHVLVVQKNAFGRERSFLSPGDDYIPEKLSIWSDDPDYPPEDWIREVQDENTRLSYWHWVNQQKTND